MDSKSLTEVFLPHLGEGVESAELALWHVKEGQVVTQGQDLCEVVTEKVSFHVESPHSGKIVSQCVEEGNEILIGALLAYMQCD
ncbi:hypothetical protein AB834_01230 [PVC group bacterium (ex Bugula neritina AB1)]|nr:hypothetical protein AB834_01230 [PVC group bacterium (ex Bugula neritina AB1)]